ncbi:fasciclin domain-containing protein [Anthocerotibacter panamensis]|uniref:fasciclin domain-containing protein n=1 Tax=Anthocerotibacter panamensis TaxID=2857077 RepID=UPI001C40627C|nr:fasciclin domain-containing protein [Anthocerotibacter panamensis]
MTQDQADNTLASALADAAREGPFTTLALALIMAQLEPTAHKGGPFTVFAPTDDAFAQLPSHTHDSLLDVEQKGFLVHLLGYHVIPGRYLAGELPQGAVQTLTEEALTIQHQGQEIFVNDARILQGNILTENGIIHIIDRVLLPS